MNECPDIDELTSAGVSAHLATCDACSALATLAAGFESASELTDDCARVEPLIAIMGVRSLDVADRERVDAHLAECPRCLATAAEVMLLEDPRSAGDSTMNSSSSPVRRDRPRPWRSIPLIASTAVAIVACVVLVLVLRSSGKDHTSETLDRRPAGTGDRGRQTHVVPRDPPPTELVSLVVLIQGQERWMGNETYLDPNDLDRMEGVYVGVVPALQVLATMGRAGSQGAVLSYAERVEVRRPMGNVRGLGEGAGRQQDYHDAIGRSLIAGLREAHDLLAKQTGHRVLVVIGDGEGQNEDVSGELAELIDALLADGIDTYTLQHHAVTTDSPVGMANMSRLGYSGARIATSRDEFAASAELFVADVARKQRLFDFDPPATATRGGIIDRTRDTNDAMLITINRGRSHGIAVGWTGVMIERGDAVRGSRFEVVRVTRNESVARVERTLEDVEGYREVVLWP